MKFHFRVIKLKFGYLIFIIAILLVFTCTLFYQGVFATEQEGIPVPIIMYHSILQDTSKSGKYVITPSTLEKDIQYIKQKRLYYYYNDSIN